MREIKFRAYHKDHKEMVNFDMAKASKDQYQCAHICNLMAGDDSGFLMQYTGLKDKNGVEIYEGDIIQFSDGYPQNHLKPKVVEFSKGSFSNTGSFDSGSATTYDPEVIGNIYENPELLES